MKWSKIAGFVFIILVILFSDEIKIYLKKISNQAQIIFNSNDENSNNTAETEFAQSELNEFNNQIANADEVDENISSEDEYAVPIIDKSLANHLLSRILCELWYSTSDTSVNLKLVSSKVNINSANPEIESYDFNNFEIGSYTEGFNLLKEAFAYSLYKGDNFWNEYDSNFFERFVIDHGHVLYKQEAPQHHGDENEDPPFSYVNPNFLDWAWSNFYRKPDEVSFTNITYQSIYDIVFKRFLRTLVVAHRQVELFGAAKEANWYWKSIILPKQDALVFIQERYINEHEIYRLEDINESVYAVMVGFWIRRYLDRTYDKIWQLASEAITDYDAEWAQQYFEISKKETPL